MAKSNDLDQPARQLIHVPIIHSPADMGTLGESLEAVYIERFGRRHWDEQVALVAEFWKLVRTELDELDLDCDRVNLYQDGLPVCGKEFQIVAEAAAQGSENHQLLLDLIARGAALVGTEDPRLLLEEYRNVRNALAGKLPEDRSAKHIDRQTGAQELLAKRDVYIGQRIGETLHPGRTGILFLGMAHKVESCLPQDIVVIRLQVRSSGARDKSR